MLILTRKMGENIVIANNITIAVLSIKGSQVKLGIEAPREVPVHREEIFIKIQNSVATATQEEKPKNLEKGQDRSEEECYPHLNPLPPKAWARERA